MLKTAVNVAVFGAFLLMTLVFGFFLWQTLFATEENGESETQSKPAYSEHQVRNESVLGGRSAPSRSNSTEEAVAEYTKWLAIFTLFLVIATVGLFVSGERNIKVADRSAKAAKQSADAAKNALIAGQRARIRIDEVELGHSMGLAIGKDGATVSIALVVTNIGNSPAIKLTFHHKLVVLAEGVSIPSEHEQVCEEARRQWQGGFTLFPNEQFPRSIGASQLSIFADAPKEAIERGLKSGQHVDLIVVGCVDYTSLLIPTHTIRRRSFVN